MSVFKRFTATLPSFFALSFLTACVWAAPTASIFVKKAADFELIQKDLKSLQAGLGADNPELDSMLTAAGRIAQMNDRCAMVSINEVLDEECSRFYQVDLPEFETKYMDLTGEIRLGALKMGNTLAERTEQIRVCAGALGGILVPKVQMLKLKGNLDLEPLSYQGGFDATYDFKLYYDAGRMEQQQGMMERWLDRCGDVVVRKTGDEFAPLFMESVGMLNDSLKQVGANVKIVVEPELLDFYLDLEHSVSAGYFLNGARLFAVEEFPVGRSNAHVVVNLANKKVNLPLGVDGTLQNFKGRVEFTSAYQEKELIGRWTWDQTESSNNAVAKLDEVPADALDTVSNSVPTNLPDQSSDKKSHNWLPQVIAGAVIMGGSIMAVAFNSKAKSERDKKPTKENYDEICDNIESAQNMRTVGLGIAALGLVGLGVSFFF
ncbi:hypothetical protein [Fibrobacter sp.]|uniref:hypothetical protein n=1 Tax=Fibrobacter sp. TaxID=35828 RepID=UPI00388DA588